MRVDPTGEYEAVMLRWRDRATNNTRGAIHARFKTSDEGWIYVGADNTRSKLAEFLTHAEARRYAQREMEEVMSAKMERGE